MAIQQSNKLALFVFFLGSLSFLLAILAENNKPQSGTAVIKGKNATICNFPRNPSVVFGLFSVVSLVLAIIVGHISVYFPYEGKSIPRNILFQNNALFSFFILAELISTLAVVVLLWTIITEGLHQVHNVHYDLSMQCISVKTGLFGGGAFLALDATIFWLISQMLTINARSDYLDDDSEVRRVYSQVYAYIPL